jgi:hypothetical protein
MAKSEFTIDLGQYLTPEQKVFIGYKEGKELRNRSNIDNIAIEPNYGKITVSIPKHVSAINPSFLEGFLGGIVGKLGEKVFNDKFKFVNTNSSYDIKPDLDETIDRVIRQKNVGLIV